MTDYEAKMLALATEATKRESEVRRRSAKSAEDMARAAVDHQLSLRVAETMNKAHHDWMRRSEKYRQRAMIAEICLVGVIACATCAIAWSLL